MKKKTNPIFREYANLTEKEQLTKLLDEVICLFAISAGGLSGFGGLSKIQDYSCVSQAFGAIKKARESNPDYPCTMLLAEFLEGRCK